VTAIKRKRRVGGAYRAARAFIIAWDAQTYAEDYRDYGEKFRGRTPQEWEDEWSARLEDLRLVIRGRRQP
jgi:hypothetical protein